MLIFTSMVWFQKIEIESRSTRFIAAQILTTSQILLEITLTFEKSPIKLNHIPILHFVVLAFIFSYSRKQQRSLIKNKKTSTLTTISLNRFRTFFVNLSPVYLSIPFFIFAFLIGILQGLFGGPSGVDERSYHWPQVLAIVQNNGIATFDSSLPWTYGYPLGKAQMAAFTWPFLKNDYAFRVPQLLYGLLMLVSIYSVGKYFSVKVGVIAALLLATSPVFMTQLRLLSDDLGYGAFTTAAVALLAKSISETDLNVRHKLYRYGILSIAISGNFKFPIISAILCVPLVIIFWHTNRVTNSNKSKSIYFSLVALASCSFYPLKNLIRTGNPLFPMTVKVGKFEIFSGPYSTINNQTAGPSTTLDVSEPLRVLKLWFAVFFDFYQTPNEDSLGAYNYLFGMFLLVLFLFALSRFATYVLTYKLILGTCLLTISFLPAIFLPRYSFYIIGMLGTFALAFLPMEKVNQKQLVLIFLLISLSILPQLHSSIQDKNWIKSQLAGKELFRNGQASVEETFSLSTNGETLPHQYVKWVHQNVKSNELVCYAASVNYPSLFWNLDRSSKVRYAPILDSDRHPNSNNPDRKYSKHQLSVWVDRNRDCNYMFAYESMLSSWVVLENWKEIFFIEGDPYIMLQRI